MASTPQPTAREALDYLVANARTREERVCFADVRRNLLAMEAAFVTLAVARMTDRQSGRARLTGTQTASVEGVRVVVE